MSHAFRGTDTGLGVIVLQICGGTVIPRAMILIIGPFPPPVHGFSVITEALAQTLEVDHAIARVNLSSNARNPWLRHLAQMSKCLSAVAHLIRFRLRGGKSVSLGANGGWGMLYTLALMMTARLIGCHTVLHHHSYTYINARSRLMAGICRIGGKSVAHVFLSQSMQDAFFALYPQQGPAHVLANAMFVPEQPIRVTTPGRITIGLLSNLSADKGLYDFIAAAERLHVEGIAVDMVLAGPVADPVDAAAITKAEKAGILRTTGPLYGEAKIAFFASIDLFVFPTRYRHEAQPTVIYEAFAAGVPVIAFDRGCIADQVGNSLTTLPQDSDFAAHVVARCRELQQLDAAGWAQLHELARQRHRDDSAAGERTLAVLFGARTHR